MPVTVVCAARSLQFARDMDDSCFVVLDDAEAITARLARKKERRLYFLHKAFIGIRTREKAQAPSRALRLG